MSYLFHKGEDSLKKIMDKFGFFSNIVGLLYGVFFMLGCIPSLFDVCDPVVRLIDEIHSKEECHALLESMWRMGENVESPVADSDKVLALFHTFSRMEACGYFSLALIVFISTLFQPFEQRFPAYFGAFASLVAAICVHLETQGLLTVLADLVDVYVLEFSAKVAGYAVDFGFGSVGAANSWLTKGEREKETGIKGGRFEQNTKLLMLAKENM